MERAIKNRGSQEASSSPQVNPSNTKINAPTAAIIAASTQKNTRKPGPIYTFDITNILNFFSPLFYFPE